MIASFNSNYEIITIPALLSHSKGFGAAYGTAKSGVGIMAMGVMRPDLIMKCSVPVIMAGIIGSFYFCRFTLFFSTKVFMA